MKSLRTPTQLARGYGVSVSTLARRIKLFPKVKIDDQTVMGAKQIKELQKRNALLGEKNLILNKVVAVFTSHSNNA